MAILGDPRQLASLQGQKKFRGPGSRAKNEEIEASRKETTSFVADIRSFIDSSYRATEAWRMAAAESYDFVENKQWEEKDIEWHKQQRRPILTFNKILPIVRILSGIERQNREEIKIIPGENGDVDDANLMHELVKFVDNDNLGMFQRTRKSNDVYITGRGFIKTDISYDENINGDIVFKRRHPLAVFVDPMGDEWDGSDWRAVADTTWIKEDEAKELWPEFADQIKIGDWLSGRSVAMQGVYTGDRLYNERLFLDQETKRVRLIDYWYKRYEIVNLAVNLDTGDVREASEGFLSAFKALDRAEQSKISFLRRKVAVIRVATVMNWLLLQDKPSPFDHRMFPIIPYLGLQYNTEPLGIVEYLKDPQRMRNKTYSQALNHLNRSANSGWLNHESKGSDPKILERFGSVPGVTLNYKEVAPQPIRPMPISAGHFTLARDSDEEIKEISLVNADLQGTGSQKTISGRAIEARQRGGLVGNEDFFDNQLLGDKILGLQLISLIQQVYTPERVKRVTQSINVQNPDAMTAAFLKDKKNEFPQIIDRALKADYDYVVDHAPASVTVRQAQFESLLQAAKDFPGSIPPDVLVDASDFPEATKARIKQHLQKLEMQAQAGATMQ